MTLAELERALDSKRRIQKEQAQQKATFDFILAELIGRSVARIYSASTTMPDIAEIYPTLFDSKEMEEIKRERQAEASAIRFKQFATSFNKKFNKEEAKDIE